MVLLEVVARIPEPMKPPINVGLLKLGPFNRSYGVQFSSTLKPLLLKLFLSSTATESCPHQGIKVWRRLALVPSILDPISWLLHLDQVDQ